MVDVNKRKKRHVFELQYNHCPQCGKKISFIKSEGKKILHCFACGFSYWNNPRPVVSALIVDINEVLLIKRTGEVYKNYWALPGGVIDYMEEPDVAIAREVFEETGLRAESVSIIDSYLIVYAPKGLTKLPSHTSIDIVYKVETRSRSPSKKPYKTNQRSKRD